MKAASLSPNLQAEFQKAVITMVATSNVVAQTLAAFG